MFTGLIQDIGAIVSIRQGQNHATLAIRSCLANEISIGDSIAVNGVCLTATRIEHDIFYVDVVPQSMRMTTLGALRISEKVNLEQAMRAQGRLDGHVVSGHIDGTGRIASLRKEGNAVLITICPASDLLKSMILQGSIAIDGVSLTICALTSKDFTVSIIPHTGLATTLLSKRIGQIVNLETDILAKYAQRSLAASSSMRGISRDFLTQHGF